MFSAVIESLRSSHLSNSKHAPLRQATAVSSNRAMIIIMTKVDFMSDKLNQTLGTFDTKSMHGQMSFAIKIPFIDHTACGDTPGF